MTDTFSLFRDLDSLLGNQDWKAALKVTDHILKLNPEDAEARACKVLLHIYLGQWNDGIQAAKVAVLPLEEAYCLYQLGDFSNALKLASIPQTSQAKQLVAQIHYRQENYQEASAIFSQLTQEEGDNTDLKSNYLAALVLGGLKDTAAEFTQKQSALARTSFEFNYNTAAFFVSVGDFEAAERSLREALRLGEASLRAEDQGDEEIAEELAVVNVQLGYVLQLKGDQATAHQLYDRQLKQKVSSSLNPRVMPR